MSTAFQPAWLRGAVEGIPPLLQPVAHALIDADEDVRKFVPPLSDDEVSSRPGGVASVAYHVKHAMGSLDRLFTYARGESLSDTQMQTLASEKTFSGRFSGAALADEFSAAVQRAFAQLRATREADLLETRLVGRARVPSNTIGLLFHAAEHTARHVGQIVTTAKLLRS